MDMSSAIARAWAAMHRIRACMFVTHDGGFLRARPMSAYPDPAAGTIWFFTSKSSAKPGELSEDRRTCVMFHDSQSGIFLSLSGLTRFSGDRSVIQAQWDAEAQLWFPGGPDDADLQLLQFVPEIGEYWRRSPDFGQVAHEIRQARAEGRMPDIGPDEKIAFLRASPTPP